MQNRFAKLVAIAAVSSLSASLAFAQGQIYKATVDCPDIGSSDKETVINYGTYLAGTGLLKVNGGPASEPLFQGPIVPGSNIPAKLPGHGYIQNGVMYNPTNGAVICKYRSTLGFDSFSVSYMMKNALNGTVASSSNDEIHLKFPVGLVKN